MDDDDNDRKRDFTTRRSELSTHPAAAPSGAAVTRIPRR